MRDWDFFVSGIEDGIIELLAHLISTQAVPPGYLKEIATYGGELDEQTLKKFVDQLTPRFPLMLISYGDGEDKEVPATSPAFGEPRIFRHDCTFSVICCSNDARGEKVQRRGVGTTPGVYQMVADARDLLAGRQFKKQGELLTLEPLRPMGVQYLARLPDLTAYAVHFDTFFKWTEPDHRHAPRPVDELIFEVTSLNSPTEPGGLPGVELRS